MPREQRPFWKFPKRWKTGNRADVSPGPTVSVPAMLVSAPSWQHDAPPAPGSSVIILPTLQTTRHSTPDKDTGSLSADSSELELSPPDVTVPEVPPIPQPPPPPPPPPDQPPEDKTPNVNTLNLLAVPDTGRTSRLSTITVAAPVRCLCAFVADRACRHCSDGRRERCDFAAAKTVGYCGLPTLVLAWGALWVLLLLGLGGMLTTPALTGG